MKRAANVIKARRRKGRAIKMSQGFRLAAGALLLATVTSISTPVWAADAPGVTATEIKIGSVFPFSGAASSIGLTGRGIIAYVQSVNDRGGVNGRKINYISLDDAYSPPKAFEHARRLVESDDVAFMFGQLGTAGNSAVQNISRRRPCRRSRSSRARASSRT